MRRMIFRLRAKLDESNTETEVSIALALTDNDKIKSVEWLSSSPDGSLSFGEFAWKSPFSLYKSHENANCKLCHVSRQVGEHWVPAYTVVGESEIEMADMGVLDSLGRLTLNQKPEASPSLEWINSLVNPTTHPKPQLNLAPNKP